MHKSYNNFFIATLLLLTTSLFSTAFADKNFAVDKVDGDLSVMVLGSGGPIATSEGRASAGYLIFVGGKPKVLMDAGGGTFQRLAESGVDLNGEGIKDLDIILLSHLHIDHMGDLSPIVKAMYFQNRVYNVDNNIAPPNRRTAPFRVFGPGENGVTFEGTPAVSVAGANPDTLQYPATSDFVNDRYDVNHGSERYLNLFSLAISGGKFAYQVEDESPIWNPASTPKTILNEDGLVIKAVGVNHGPVPALAFRIEYGGKTIVYSGDTSSKGENMGMISEGADLLIYDTALFFNQPPADRPDLNIFYLLHTTPARIGQVAHQAHVKTLVLSHITPQTEGKFDAVEDMIRAEGYEGKIKVAKDLKVYNLLPTKGGHD